MNAGKECLLHYYWNKDSKEIGMIIENNGELPPFEINNPPPRVLSWQARSKCWIPAACRGGCVKFFV